MGYNSLNGISTYSPKIPCFNLTTKDFSDYDDYDYYDYDYGDYYYNFDADAFYEDNGVLLYGNSDEYEMKVKEKNFILFLFQCYVHRLLSYKRWWLPILDFIWKTFLYSYLPILWWWFLWVSSQVNEELYLYLLIFTNFQ